MSRSELYDPGAQPERTLLAWGRTCLASSVVVALMVKVLAVSADAVMVVLTVVGLALPVLAWFLAVARYRRVHRTLISTRSDSDAGPSGPGGGAAMLAATGAAVLCGALALYLVLG